MTQADAMKALSDGPAFAAPQTGDMESSQPVSRKKSPELASPVVTPFPLVSITADGASASLPGGGLAGAAPKKSDGSSFEIIRSLSRNFLLGAMAISIVAVAATVWACWLLGFLLRDGILQNDELCLWVASLSLPTLAFSALIIRYRRTLKSLADNHDRLRELAGRLIQGQEIESSRIAREVHDDINQQLASLSIGLSALKRKIGDPHASDVNVLQQRLHSTIEDVRRISRNLHPSVLRHVGLPAALEALCQHEAEHRKFSLLFQADAQTGAIPEDAALCLYRVAQEALRNIAEHAIASVVRVTLQRQPQSIELLIEDNGHGFDSEHREQGAGRGIGLSCMEERVRLLYGALDIRSAPGVGCSIRANVPVAP
jgi:signal transduction histidine kinase